MNTNELKELVELYIDNSLEKSKEPLLFSSLAGNDEAREYFFNLNVIRSSVEKDMQPFPTSLDERIFNSLKDRDKKNEISGFHHRPQAWLYAAVALIFILISGFLFSEVRSYQNRMDSISQQIEVQNKTIDLILNNTLPPAEVSGRSVNEIIVHANL
jgi:hypothetical protein